MSDSGNKPSNTRHTAGVELMFVFMLPALMVVGSIAGMATTGYWWLMGVAFAGALLATGLIAVTIMHYTGDESEVTPIELELSASVADRSEKFWQPKPRHRRHRLALHH